MTDAFLDMYYWMVKKIRLFWKSDRPEAHSSEFHLQTIYDELAEVKEEMKKDNMIYLEDELSDIMRNYMNLLYLLEDEWKISSWKKVFERSYSKFSERVNDQFNWIRWKETKVRQKRNLKAEHSSYYKS